MAKTQQSRKHSTARSRVYARAAAEWLEWRACGHLPAPPSHVLIDMASSIRRLAGSKNGR